MFLRQVFDPHLAQYAYVIGCQRTGEAIVIDPERDIDRYVEIAAQEGLRITAVAETHIHADFVSGAREFVAADPTVKVYVSEEGGVDWQSEWIHGLRTAVPLRDGSLFKVGNLTFQALHTPGHTPEHLSYLLTDEGGGANEPIALLTGDFLFVGDAGRPDLLEQAAGIAGAQEIGARALYQSLRKIINLPGHLQVLPAHGAGSACGKALGSVPTSTLGYELKFNPALKMAANGSKKEFMQFILSGQPEPPAYFANMKHLNKVGPSIVGRVPSPPQLSIDDVMRRLAEPEEIVVDTRSREAFLAGHLRGSLFAPAEKFSDFAGSFLTPENEVIVVARDLPEAENFARQLLRMGFDRLGGFLLSSDVDAAPRAAIAATRAVQFSEIPAILSGGAAVLDVRKATEHQSSHLRGALNIAHTRLRPRLAEISAARPYVVHCQSGLRATAAVAYLAREGRDVTCVTDSFAHAPKEWLED